MALRERLDRAQVLAAGEAARRAERIRAIAEDAAKRWKAEWREVDHAELLYDERGLPR